MYVATAGAGHPGQCSFSKLANVLPFGTIMNTVWYIEIDIEFEYTVLLCIYVLWENECRLGINFVGSECMGAVV